MGNALNVWQRYTMFRIPRCPYFNTNEYRVLEDEPADHECAYITCYSKRAHQHQHRQTHKKYKAGLIKVASSRCRIDLSRVAPQEQQESEADSVTSVSESRRNSEAESNEEREEDADYF